jgi:hypothetical protein
MLYSFNYLQECQQFKMSVIEREIHKGILEDKVKRSWNKKVYWSSTALSNTGTLLFRGKSTSQYGQKLEVFFIDLKI